MRRIQQLLIIVAVAGGVATIAADAAFAFFGAGGSGTTSAHVATLNAPVNASATYTSGTSTVHVAWSPVTPPGATLGGYDVKRYAGVTASPACGGVLQSGTSCDDTNVAAGTYTYKIVAVFRSWTSTGAATNAVTVADTTPPAAPSAVTLANGTGTAGAYVGNTNKASINVDVTLAGSSIASDTVVLVVRDAGNAHSAIRSQPAPDGSATMHFTGLDVSSFVDGTLTMSATASDAAGNVSGATTALTTKDTVVPIVTSIVRAAASPTNALSLSWTVTFAEPVKNVGASNFGLIPAGIIGTPTINGVTPSSATLSAAWTVTVAMNDSIGQGSSLGVDLTGKGTIQDGATNALGGAVPVVGALYVFDNTPPTVSTPDLAAVSDSGTSSTDNLTKVTTPQFSGTAEAGSTVTLFDGSTLVGSAVSAANSTWAITSSSLVGGSHTITAKATDAVGNSTTSAALSITIDATAPTVSAVDLANNGTAKKADNNDTIAITFSAQLAVSSMCPSWTDDTSSKSASGPQVTVSIANSGTNDILTVANTGCSGSNLGTILLGGDYVSNTATFSGNGNNSSRIDWNPTTRVLTITLGAVAGGSGNVRTNVTAGAPAYIPPPISTPITDTAGNALTATFASSAADSL